MNSEALVTLIHDALYRLGFRANHSGFFYLSYSVLFCIHEGTDQIPAMRLHAEAARHYRTSPQTVNDQIHAVVAKVWKTDRIRMKAIMGDCLKRCPSDIEILAYLYRYVTEQDLEKQ